MKIGRVDGLVEVVPMDGVGGDFVFDDIPVFGAAAGEGACADDECAGIVQHSFLATKAMPGEVFRRELKVDGIGDTQTETGKAVRRECNDRHWHRGNRLFSAKLKLFFSLASSKQGLNLILSNF